MEGFEVAGFFRTSWDWAIWMIVRATRPEWCLRQSSLTERMRKSEKGWQTHQSAIDDPNTPQPSAAHPSFPRSRLSRRVLTVSMAAT